MIHIHKCMQTIKFPEDNIEENQMTLHKVIPLKIKNMNCETKNA